VVVLGSSGYSTPDKDTSRGALPGPAYEAEHGALQYKQLVVVKMDGSFQEPDVVASMAKSQVQRVQWVPGAPPPSTLIQAIMSKVCCWGPFALNPEHLTLNSKP
jgi:hypothetical protein